MAGYRIVLSVFAVALGAQAVVYALNADTIRAWPSPIVWFGLLVVAVTSTTVAVAAPGERTLHVAAVSSGAVYALRVAELGYALLWGRLVVVAEAVRATGWLAVTRDLSALVAVFGMWAGALLMTTERDAHGQACERPVGRRRRSAVARAVGDDHRRHRRDAHRAQVDRARAASHAAGAAG